MSAPVVVLKFGGTSLASAERVRRAALRVKAHRERGLAPVVVVSASGHATDRIVARLAALGGAAGAEDASARESDRALATGEDLSAALLAFALGRLGVAARSVSGREAGVRAEGHFGAGRIRAVDPLPLSSWIRQGVVPVVSGFQGGRLDGETLTLGRGGSDTSAVAIAAALEAVRCDIITDVRAVCDRDPRRYPDAVAYPTMSYEALLEIARAGAVVVHPAAAEIARDARVPLRIYHHRAPLSGRGGTWITASEHLPVEAVA